MKEVLKELVKKVLGNGLLILLIVAVLYILFLRECKHSAPCPAENEIIIKQSTWDSLQALANKPPEIKIDTQWITKPTVTPDPQPSIPEPTIDELWPEASIPVYDYADSLVNKEINVWVNYKVRGELLAREWRYKPITTEISIDSIIYKPYPVKVDKLVTVSKNGLYAYGIAGGNESAFIYGGGLDLITKKETMIGYQFQRFGTDNFHSVRLGIKIKFGKN